MGKSATLKALVIPAVISLILFLLSTYVLIPVWRRARDRYSQYIPVDTITSQTFSLRQRMSNGISNMIAQPFWRRGQSQHVAVGDHHSDDGMFDDAEELTNVHPNTRRAIESTLHNGPDSNRRLSRDLEEGFRDDSEDEDEDDRRGQRR